MVLGVGIVPLAMLMLLGMVLVVLRQGLDILGFMAGLLVLAQWHGGRLHALHGEPQCR